MKKKKPLNQIANIIKSILLSFFVVFTLYFISLKVNNFAYDYFMFPFISIIIIFFCGITVGRSLERMKNNEYEKNNKTNNGVSDTEFLVNERKEIITHKKIIEDPTLVDRIHVKVFNYDEINSIDNEEV